MDGWICLKLPYIFNVIKSVRGLCGGLRWTGRLQKSLLLGCFAQSGDQLAFGAASSKAVQVADAQTFAHSTKFCCWQSAK